MLENTEIFKTKENKELDELLKKYQDLNAQAKDIETSLTKIKDRIKTICKKTAGTYETGNYVFALDQSNRTSVNVIQLVKDHANIWETIPPEVITIKVKDLREGFADIWETVPQEVIKTTPILSMGTISRKTNI